MAAVSTRNYPIVLIFGPVVIWTAFRLGNAKLPRHFHPSAIAVWGTLHGFRPIRRKRKISRFSPRAMVEQPCCPITAMALSAGMAERRRVEEELQQQKLVVKSANGTKTVSWPRFARIRTPLTPVMSALERSNRAGAN